MRIVIDMQGAQTESRFRGIGRYTISFSQAVVRNCGEHEIILALNGLFPDTIEPIRAAFDGLLPQENIRVWHAPGPVNEEQPGNDARRDTAELLREAFLSSLQPDVIHVPSLFEGFIDNAVTSIGRFDTATPVSVILYDLIPLLNPKYYLKHNKPYEQYYLRKVEHLRRAATYLAISDFTRKEGIDALSIESEKVVNISTAIDGCFQPQSIDALTGKQLKQKFGISRAFVLYTGGADERKNLPRLIQAYAALPSHIRISHQLVLAGKTPEGERVRLTDIARSAGMKPDELIFAGYVTDDKLAQLYNLCALYVFPSWHEGFGLPALEAMACGAPVIGANTSSVPEVIGLDEALFDPFDVAAITTKMVQALSDEGFRTRLREHGQQQATHFSWDVTARRAIEAWEALVPASSSSMRYQERSVDKEKLLSALVRFIPENEKNLIAIAACIAQNESSGIERQLMLDVSELYQCDAATGVQRVVRSYLKWLLQSPPDGFRVEPVYATRDQSYRYARAYTERLLGLEPSGIADNAVCWQRGDIFFGLDMQHHVQLAHSRFYQQLKFEGVTVKFLVYDLLPIQLAEMFDNADVKELHEQWLAMIASTDGAICISKATADAFKVWLGDSGVVPSFTFRTSWVHIGADIESSMASVGEPSNAKEILAIIRQRLSFLCVSTLEPRKRQQQILEAVELLWQEGKDVNLVLVGKEGWKIEAFAKRLRSHPEMGARLLWLEGISDDYLQKVYAACTCLVAASINEGFGLSLIEAARHGIPVIARDIPVFREVAGEHAYYFQGDRPEDLAAAYKVWLGLRHHQQHPHSLGMPWSTWQQSTEKLKVELIENNYPRRQLLVDISELVQRDAKTGIHRVVRNILNEWLHNPPVGYRVEPVYATVEDGYRYSNRFTQEFIGVGADKAEQDDEPINYAPGDFFIGLDLNHHVPRVHDGFLSSMHQAGVNVIFLVYDLPPIQFPQYWEAKHAVDQVVREWMSVITKYDGAICISKTVADELACWHKESGASRQRPFKIGWFHLGADIDNSDTAKGLPAGDVTILVQMQSCPSFLMVGTLEPRKGHAQVLDAFEQLWQSGVDVNLVIAGKQGWMVETLVDRLRVHPELNKRLFWLEGISDEYLEKVYAASTCLIAASYGEGFGLPLIEAAQHKLPIIARDIPVFREVAGEYAYYFNSTQPEGLAESIQTWISLYENSQHPKSDAMPWLTWKESAAQLQKAILTIGE